MNWIIEVRARVTGSIVDTTCTSTPGTMHRPRRNTKGTVPTATGWDRGMPPDMVAAAYSNTSSSWTRETSGPRENTIVCRVSDSAARGYASLIVVSSSISFS